MIDFNTLHVELCAEFAQLPRDADPAQDKARRELSALCILRAAEDRLAAAGMAEEASEINNVAGFGHGVHFLTRNPVLA